MSDKEIIEFSDTQMTPISLGEMAQLSLMNRQDTKFMFPIHFLDKVLLFLQSDYKILEIKGKRILPYSTIYFDTDDLKLQSWHQNGKLNRFKVRYRNYLQTGESFLEVKHKTNKKKTIKKRIDSDVSSEEKQRFVKKVSRLNFERMKPCNYNQFLRMTFAHRSRPERITIDTQLRFSADGKHWENLDGICVAELKSSGKTTSGDSLWGFLKKHKIYTGSFSKFIVGMYLTGNAVKQNRYKALFKQIENMRS